MDGSQDTQVHVRVHRDNFAVPVRDDIEPGCPHCPLAGIDLKEHSIAEGVDEAKQMFMARRTAPCGRQVSYQQEGQISLAVRSGISWHSMVALRGSSTRPSGG